jgi:serine/threonine protein kinase
VYEGSQVGPPDRPGHYRLVKRLGAGAEGEVWKAREVLPGGNPLDVAIKICHGPASTADERRWHDLGSLMRNVPLMPGLVRVNEAFTGARPSIDPAVRTGGPGTSPDRLPAGPYGYVVMQFVPGSSLEQRTDLPIDRRLRALRPVAAALDRLHLGLVTYDGGLPRRLPIVHGDVKPSNVVLDAEDLGVLVDLGSATLLAERRPTGRTLLYAAPELAAGGVATPDTDRYAFVATVAHVVLNHAAAPDLAALDRDPLVSRAPRLRQLLAGALTAPPQERPRSLERWLDELLRLIPAGPDRTVAPVAGSLPRAARAGNGRAVAAGVAASVVVAGAAIVLVMQLRTQATPPGAEAAGSASPTLGPRPSVSPSSTRPSAPPSSRPSSRTPSSPPTHGTASSSSPAGDPVTHAGTVTVGATIGCDPASCTTSELTISLGGSFRGELADDHELMLFTHAPDGRYYPGARSRPSGGRWSGAVHVGSEKGSEAQDRYPTCVYDIDADFADHMTSLGGEAGNGFTRLPTTGAADSLACTTVTWNRP